MKIYCCGCNKEVKARLTNGAEIYPHRPDLANLPFWKCDYCKNFVGCHHKTKHRTRPLGCIPTQEIKDVRKRIHALIDPLWQKKLVPRGKLYAMISSKLGYAYHTADIKSVENGKEIYNVAREIIKSLRA